MSIVAYAQVTMMGLWSPLWRRFGWLGFRALRPLASLEWFGGALRCQSRVGRDQLGQLSLLRRIRGSDGKKFPEPQRCAKQSHC
jgi:hypothetical protein